MSKTLRICLLTSASLCLACASSYHKTPDNKNNFSEEEKKQPWTCKGGFLFGAVKNELIPSTYPEKKISELKNEDLEKVKEEFPGQEHLIDELYPKLKDCVSGDRKGTQKPCILLIGPKGCGKTYLLNKLIKIATEDDLIVKEASLSNFSRAGLVGAQLKDHFDPKDGPSPDISIIGNLDGVNPINSNNSVNEINLQIMNELAGWISQSRKVILKGNFEWIAPFPYTPCIQIPEGCDELTLELSTKITSIFHFKPLSKDDYEAWLDKTLHPLTSDYKFLFSPDAKKHLVKYCENRIRTEGAKLFPNMTNALDKILKNMPTLQDWEERIKVLSSNIDTLKAKIASCQKEQSRLETTKELLHKKLQTLFVQLNGTEDSILEMKKNSNRLSTNHPSNLWKNLPNGASNIQSL